LLFCHDGPFTMIPSGSECELVRVPWNKPSFLFSLKYGENCTPYLPLMHAG